jgi:inositol oxygenase
VLRTYLPFETLAIVRYHSCYAWHGAGAYRALMNERDEAALRQVQLFNRYDLYSKSDRPPDWNSLRPYYRELVAEFLPDALQG